MSYELAHMEHRFLDIRQASCKDAILITPSCGCSAALPGDGMCEGEPARRIGGVKGDDDVPCGKNKPAPTGDNSHI
jgi:hypothetical protein